VVPESKDPEAPGTQHTVAPTVVARALLVLPAIQLDNQAMFNADEVDDVWADRMLPSELRSAHAPRSQVIPEPALRFG
jgi:hypothetical protein